MNAQQLFDKVAKHLLTQRERSTNGPNCAYRGDNGLRCAIGALMPNRVYRRGYEGAGVDELPKAVIKACGINANNMNLALSLQFVHDQVDVSKWKGRLRTVAKEYGLKPNTSRG